MKEEMQALLQRIKELQRMDADTQFLQIQLLELIVKQLSND